MIKVIFIVFFRLIDRHFVIHLSIIARPFPDTRSVCVVKRGRMEYRVPFLTVFLFLFIRVYPKEFTRPPSSRKYITRARKFIGTRSALTRGKRNRYRDKMVGNSQSAHPLDLDALPFLRSARVHRAKRGQRREQRISLVKRKRRKLSNGHKRVVPLDLSSIPSNLPPYPLATCFRYRIVRPPNVCHLPPPPPYETHNYYNVYEAVAINIHKVDPLKRSFSPPPLRSHSSVFLCRPLFSVPFRST